MADLLRDLAKCDPAAIALDFNMRSPASDGSLHDNDDYKGETDNLRNALLEVSKDHPVILPATLGISSKGRYTLDAAIYDGLPLSRGGIQTGYIQPPFDARLVPIAVNLAGGGTIDSFAESIVRALNPDLVEELGDNDSLPFGTFMQEDEFQQVMAADILAEASRAEACKPIRHNIALIGAAWHQESYQRGTLIDLHPSPLGPMSGVYLHANYIEAMLDSRTYIPLGEDFHILLEFTFSLLVAFLLAIKMSSRRKTVLAVASLCLVVMLLSYFFWQNLGIFFDFFFPVIFLLAHALIEYIRETREYIKGLRERIRELEGQTAPA